MSINTVALSGRMVADPELKYTPAGKAVCSFRIAVQRNFKKEGSEEYEADFFTCSCWEHSAKFVTEYIQQGDLVGITGRLQNHSYTNPETGLPITMLQIQCNDVTLLTKKGQNADGSPIQRREGQQQRPAGQQQAAARQQTKRSAPPEFDDDGDTDPFRDE